MADITMCQDTECIHKDKCYRYTAVVNKFRQSYFAEKVRDKNGCSFYIPVTK